MQIIDMNAALAGLGAIALGLGGLLLVGRDRAADQHDVSDYHAPEPVAVKLTVDAGPFVDAVRRDWPLLDVDTQPDPLTLVVPVDCGVTPPLARQALIDWAVPTLSDAAVRGIADEWLREIAYEQRAKAGAR
ncbi:hypothetical protein [Micromonospora sp. WMMD998]|uniref:hypothetical protein n=1 Tax=Micromonospora sp. WMMD998 TaxID=3016092 RepID=UPI00249CB9CF|nr:hypothetical protein [Micromonospora sp. WMMD998]WFE41916.1 hypothetical protein O7619_27110 [Micromonospora sp. WMMD998]